MTEASNNKEASDGPVQVFILLGQSNMLGFGRVDDPQKPGTLEYLMEKEGKYSNLKDDNNKWFQSNNVRYVQTMFRHEKVAVLRNEWLHINPRNKFGPELGMGVVMGPFMQDKKKRILLLKACIGNRSLGWDLLPPGSEQFEHDGKIYAGYKESPLSWEKGTEPKPIGWYAGKQYDDDISCCKKVLANIGDYYPGATDYEVAGFAFWQGHKDNDGAHASRYEQNLVQFIHSLRKDFDAPEAKFVCATVAFGGHKMEGNMLKIANAQLAVSGNGADCKYPEFHGNVLTIDARPFWREKEQSPVNQSHHYHQNGETFYEVGRALGQAMVDLLERNDD